MSITYAGTQADIADTARDQCTQADIGLVGNDAQTEQFAVLTDDTFTVGSD